jgi:hypothetical protein
MHCGMKVDIKIQSITDVITNSSTEIYTIYTSGDIKTIKNIVDALLAVNGDSTFDDLFNIKLLINEDVVQYLWNSSEEIQKEYPNDEDFYKYLETCTNQNELDRFESIWYDDGWDSRFSFYNGYRVTLKPGIEVTEKLQHAIDAIHTLDSIFDYEISYDY